MKCYPTCEYITMESAIRAGSEFFLCIDLYEKEKVSGGSICPKCNKWTTIPRKRKVALPTWIHDCDECEIKDDFLRMFHKFNKTSCDTERDIYNNWLHKVRHHLEELNYTTATENSKSKLKELIHKLPFFEGL